MIISKGKLTSLCRVSLWLAVVATLWFAFTPHPPGIFAWDKAEHGLAFSVLTLTLVAAYPLFGWVRSAIAMSCLGAGIELVQAIPTLHRDSSLDDWFADNVAIVLALVVIVSIRAVFGRFQERKITTV
jgi:VanZ family protein